jgi:hypothetical protein
VAGREVLPLILAIVVPIFLVSLILLYISGYDVTLFLRRIPFIYYVIMTPIVLGFVAAVMHLRKKE